MGTFSKISQTAFDSMQMDAGMILKTFDPTNATAPTDTNIVCATSGGITASCTPSFIDLGDDVDNCPANIKELKRIEGYECKLSFTALNASAELIRMALGAADVTTSSGKIAPRGSLSTTDFSDIWWVGDLVGGGMVAVCLKNALSTGGFSLKTTKNGKGQISVELTGHVSITSQDEIPMEFYVKSSTTAVSN